MIKYAADYNPILDYWEDIQNGEIVSDKVRRVYKKLVDDLNNPDLEWEYSSKRANHAIEFIENFLKHSKGQVKPFILERWQKALVGATFGFIHKETELRKYRELVLIVARKNGRLLPL